MTNGTARSDAKWTIRRLLTWTREHFEAHRIDEPRLAAELLLAQATGWSRIELYTRVDDEPTPEQRAAFREMVRAAADHRPIAYLIGHKEFYALDFVVTPDVLIPRPETELLVERALIWCKPRADSRINLLEIGTGSGCIAVTLAKRQSSVHVVATDISAAALAVAADNAGRHAVTDRITFVEADMLALPSAAVPDGGFDVIVSNPPYVATQDRKSLPENVRRHEPEVALFSGPDGLEAYRALARDVPRCLRPDGCLIVEIGSGQAEAVETLFTKNSNLTLVGCYKDLSGIDRTLEFGPSG